MEEGVDGHCFYALSDGRREPGVHDWEGRQGASEGDHIGMLLEFDQGSMTVWKNDVKLGVMQAEGLGGPLCWAVSLGEQGDSARIESAPAPASPTEEELAAEKMWAAKNDPAQTLRTNQPARFSLYTILPLDNYTFPTQRLHANTLPKELSGSWCGVTPIYTQLDSQSILSV